MTCYTVVLKEEVERDVQEAYNWYESKRNLLGDSFIAELESYLNILEKEPQIFQVRKANRRYCPLKRYPYVIVYEIENDLVIVYAVFNTFKNPARLTTRK